MLLSENELEKLLQRRVSEGKRILFLQNTIRSHNFSMELEETYFPPGTSSNKGFELIWSPFGFFLIVPDNPRNRSAISVLSHKHKLTSPSLTKFDNYMELAYKIRTPQDNSAFREKMFQDTLKFISENYNLKAIKSIAAFYCSKKQWSHFSKKFAKFGKASTAVSLRNHTVKNINGKFSIEPKENHHIIFFNCTTFLEMNLQDMVYNFILTVAHEIFHLCGIRDEVKVHMLEFKVSEEFLEIYHTPEYKRKKRREVESIHKQKRQYEK
jgi:hypothetical protein